MTSESLGAVTALTSQSTRYIHAVTRQALRRIPVRFGTFSARDTAVRDSTAHRNTHNASKTRVSSRTVLGASRLTLTDDALYMHTHALLSRSLDCSDDSVLESAAQLTRCMAADAMPSRCAIRRIHASPSRIGNRLRVGRDAESAESRLCSSVSRTKNLHAVLHTPCQHVRIRWLLTVANSSR